MYFNANVGDITNLSLYFTPTRQNKSYSKGILYNDRIIQFIYYHRSMEKVIPLPPLGTQGRNQIFLILKAHLQDIEMGSKT